MEFFQTSMINVLFQIIIFSVHVHALSKDHGSIMNDKASLISFMSGIKLDPENILKSWKTNVTTNVSTLYDSDICNWYGVGCNKARDRVVELDLSGRSLRGIISPSLANLSCLNILDLSRNFFEGTIPREIGRVVELKQLSLSWNLLRGTIPDELGSLHKLVYLDLGSNRFVGNLPFRVLTNKSSSLEYIDVSNNSLSGEIPSRFELKELRYLLLWSNKLVGQVPKSLSNSSKLEWIDFESNMFEGELPSDITRRMPRLQFLYLSYNRFVSHDGNTNLEPFFNSLVNASKLQELELAGNNLGGKLPSVIGKLSSNLVQLHLDQNLIYGSIPPQLSNLMNLTLLNLSTNLLNGTIPPELCRISKLERVYLSNNSLSGEIPYALGNIPHLGLLDLSNNKLSGMIPDSFANLSQLRRLLLYANELSGTIPPSLGKCINLEILDLSRNRISGRIPSEVAGLSSLKLYLNLSRNLLYGELPLELSKMDMVLAIDLSSNNLSGEIPPQLVSCIALEYLNLSDNVLTGVLPSSIGQLPYLKELDVSSNELIGQLPLSLQVSSTLEQLNVSFNKFSGKIPDNGVFSTLTFDSFLGNTGLCGSLKGMPTCRKKYGHRVVLSIVFSLFGTSLFCMVGYRFMRKSRTGVSNKRHDVEEEEEDDTKYPRISYRQLIQATGGFNDSSLIGSGQFGHVYKGILQDSTRIAVKVLDPKTAGEFSDSFKRECQVLKRTRHRNLIRIITICSKPDFKALVLPLMSNGSLERHLYPTQQPNQLGLGLDLVQVVKICSDVAEGVAYLHHYSPVKVVHCDLKPSNILLDDHMTALVTDFGISRLVKRIEESVVSNDSVSFGSTDGLLCGSVGYIAPEYGMGKHASIHGDVYSFGVLLLEIVTGKRPTDVLVHESSSLHELVKSCYPHKLDQLVEPALVRFKPKATTTAIYSHEKMWHEVVLELIELGLMCTQYSPSTRPSMLDVAYEMGRLKEYITNPSSQVLIGQTSCRG